MKQFAIFGSGFGLYGYLPALASCGQKLRLPERYRARFTARSELAPYSAAVNWDDNEETLLTRANGVVLALQPKLQQQWLSQCLAQPQIQHLLLEKPLASSPLKSALVFKMLLESEKVFRIGYIFRFTSWGKQLFAELKANPNWSKLSIQWKFKAHHFTKNLPSWKSSTEEGGGAIRFYGIHLLALLAELGYRQVQCSETDNLSNDLSTNWRAILTGKGLPLCEIDLESRTASKQFKIISSSKSAASQSLTDLNDPFDLPRKANSALLQGKLEGEQDPRVPILGQLYNSLWEPSEKFYQWYGATLDLWQAVEDKNKITLLKA